MRQQQIGLVRCWTLSRRDVILCSALLLGVADSIAAAPQKEVAATKAKIINLWKSFDSVDCSYDEQCHTTDGSSQRGHIDFCWKAEGRSAFAIARGTDTNFSHAEVREDGVRKYSAIFFPGKEKQLNQILIEEPKNAPGAYGGKLFYALWMFMPGGKSIGRVIEDGGELTDMGEGKTDRWFLKANLRGYRVEGWLDEGHQFLPKSLKLRPSSSKQGFLDSSHTLATTRFGESGGFSFPMAGSDEIQSDSEHGSQTTIVQFSSQRFSLNEFVPGSRFSRIKAESGCEIVNLIDKTSRIEGGKFARVRLKAKRPQEKVFFVADEKPVVVPSGVDDSSHWSRLSMALASLAVALGGLGIFLYRRGS